MAARKRRRARVIDATAPRGHTRLEPWLQYAHLAHLLEEIPRERQLVSALALVHASHIIFRHFAGQRTDQDVLSALDVARELIRKELRATEASAA